MFICFRWKWIFFFRLKQYFCAFYLQCTNDSRFGWYPFMTVLFFFCYQWTPDGKHTELKHVFVYLNKYHLWFDIVRVFDLHLRFFFLLLYFILYPYWFHCFHSINIYVVMWDWPMKNVRFDCWWSIFYIEYIRRNCFDQMEIVRWLYGIKPKWPVEQWKINKGKAKQKREQRPNINNGK